MAEIVITCREEDRESVKKLAGEILGNFLINTDPSKADLHIIFTDKQDITVVDNKLTISIPFSEYPLKKTLQTSVRNAMKIGAAWIYGKKSIGEQI